MIQYEDALPCWHRAKPHRIHTEADVVEVEAPEHGVPEALHLLSRVAVLWRLVHSQQRRLKLLQRLQCSPVAHNLRGHEGGECQKSYPTIPGMEVSAGYDCSLGIGAGFHHTSGSHALNNGGLVDSSPAPPRTGMESSIQVIRTQAQPVNTPGRTYALHVCGEDAQGLNDVLVCRADLAHGERLAPHADVHNVVRVLEHLVADAHSNRVVRAGPTEIEKGVEGSAKVSLVGWQREREGTTAGLLRQTGSVFALQRTHKGEKRALEEEKGQQCSAYPDKSRLVHRDAYLSCPFSRA